MEHSSNCIAILNSYTINTWSAINAEMFITDDNNDKNDMLHIKSTVLNAMLVLVILRENQGENESSFSD